MKAIVVNSIEAGIELAVLVLILFLLLAEYAYPGAVKEILSSKEQMRVLGMAGIFCAFVSIPACFSLFSPQAASQENEGGP